MIKIIIPENKVKAIQGSTFHLAKKFKSHKFFNLNLVNRYLPGCVSGLIHQPRLVMYHAPGIVFPYKDISCD